MNDPKNRRFKYPFINCTHCGPRFTIIQDLPYDRPNTSMANFHLCDACFLEYIAPYDRRFHAQATACSSCGPSVTLVTHQKTVEADPVDMAIQMLKQGKILAIKGMGGFHLAVDATNTAAVLRLRKLKNRPDKPFALMSATVEKIKQFAEVGTVEESLLESAQSPIVILTKKYPTVLSTAISKSPTFGVMLPYTPLHHLIVTSFSALVMTSGNVSDQPIISRNDVALENLAFADAFLLHDRPILNPCDDSIVCVINKETQMIRRARGYVPGAIRLQKSMPKILALGGHLKNTLCLAHHHYAYLSQHLGDLSSVDTIQWMQSTIDQMIQLTGISPEWVACDMHPDYQSTRMAEKMGLPIIQVQHHHAHVAACMAENGIMEPVLGIILDGTGYGLDQTIWGGEVLLCEKHTFRRVAHLETVPMPGGASAIQYPWKMALSWLLKTFGTEGLDIFNHIQPQAFDQHSAKIVQQALDQKILSPLTSSMGRLFDTVSALTGLCQSITYEGQAAIELENIAGDTHRKYSYHYIDKDITIVQIQPMIHDIIKDIRSGIAVSEISGAFHTTIVDLLTDLCHHLKSKFEMDHVVLSGGVFQNKRLFSGLKTKLQEHGFYTYAHAKVPCNDGGLSLGQAYVAGLKVARVGL